MDQNQDLLSVTAFFSALVHAIIILGISFKLPDIKALENTDNTLDVVLINTPNDEVPVESDTVSTSDNLGGGEDDKEASSPIPYQVVTPSPVQSIKKTATQEANNTKTPDQFITAQTAEVAINKKPQQETKLQSKPKTTGEDRVTTKTQRQLERERLVAKLSQSFEDYSKRPKKEFLSPTTSKHEAAKYLDDWRKKVVAVGNANYPIQAKAKGIYGTLILTVEINRNGTIAAIQINNPSPHKILNDAAMRFVRNASPFDSFPDSINVDTDILVITRAFHFLENNRLSSSDASSQR